MTRTCLFPGTFDPITKGHVDVIRRSLDMFDELVIGVGVNSSKEPMFPMEQRIAWMQEIFKNEPRVRVASYSGLTIRFCQELGAKYMLRGIRSVGDFEYEKAIADMNRMLMPEVESVFLTTAPLYATVSSTLVRDLIRNGADVGLFVPEEVVKDL